MAGRLRAIRFRTAARASRPPFPNRSKGYSHRQRYL